VRADPLEGLDLIHQPNRIASLKITIDRKDTELASHLIGPFTARRTGNLCNLFCMHGIRTIRPNNSLIDRRNLKFGDSFVMVTHMQEFLNRINVMKWTPDLGPGA
jgi:hypothetical protein